MDANVTDPSNSTLPPFVPPPWRWNVSVALCMAIIGILANGALLLVILLNRHLRTTSNILVCNLAIADLMMFVFTVPMSTVSWLFLSWPRGAFGSFLCKMGGGAWVLAQSLCATSLTAVSIERYCSLQRRIQMKRTVAILVVVWCIGVLFTIPLLVLGHTRYAAYTDMNFCILLPLGIGGIRAYLTTYAILTYFLPVLIITCCYVGMARVLFSRGSGESIESVRARRRLAIVVLFLAIAFTVFWFPYHFIHFFFLYSDLETILSSNYDVYIRLSEIAHVLIYVNSCLNPFVVFIVSRVHRKPLLDFLCCRKKQDGSKLDRRYAPVPDGAYAETTISAN